MTNEEIIESYFYDDDLDHSFIDAEDFSGIMDLARADEREKLAGLYFSKEAVDVMIADERGELSGEAVKVWVSFDAEPLNYCRMYSIEPYELEIGNAYGCRGGSISDISYGFARMLNVQRGECKAFEIRECGNE